MTQGDDVRTPPQADDQLEPAAAVLPEQPAPVSATRRRPRWWVVVLIVVGVLLVAVADLAWQGNKLRAKDIWTNTTFAFPATINGLPRRDTDFTKQWSEQTAGIMRDSSPSRTFTVSATGYGDPDQPTIIVLVARPDSGQNEAMLHGMRRGMARSMADQGVTLEDIDPGALGGSMTCGTTKGASICIAVDAAGEMIIEMPATSESAAKSRQVRELVETRR